MHEYSPIHPIVPIAINHLDGTFTLQEARNVRAAFGEEGFAYFVRTMKSLRSNPGKYEPFEISNEYGIHAHFTSLLQRIFDITEHEVPYLYRTAMKTANECIDYLLDTMTPTLKDKLSLRVEVRLFPGFRPAQRLSLLANNNDPVMQFETERQLILAYLAAQIDKRNEFFNLSLFASEAQRALLSNLYTSRRTQEFNIWSTHDNADNNVTTIGTPDSLRPAIGEHVKRHQFEVRETKQGEIIFTDTREKDLRAATLKAVAKKADHNGDITTKEVTDNMGIMFVHMGTNNRFNWNLPEVTQIEDFSRRTLSAIQKNVDIACVVEDDKVGNERNQSNQVRWIRKQVYFPTIELPLELLFFSLPDYLNYRYQTGEYNQETGLYTGQGHELYLFKRNRNIMPNMFPPSLYDNDRIQEAMRIQQENIVVSLRNANRIDRSVTSSL
ncbi:hypothetical protein HY468_00005 [Candidatus Roizmanbacteria bacterium]|nr:hypothetical protein [Candidatus Roizmanbacteria bacterium]